jgi:hypothetical protein
MRIGYSCWGFLGDGIVDTPDGGRSHRRTLLQALAARGHQLVLLQRDRDRLEAGERIDLGPRFAHRDGLPQLDLLWLEWRWPIPGRNLPADRGRPGYTPDLSRQHQLVEHYTIERRLPTLLWDKDLTLDPGDPLRARENVVVMEAALWPREGAQSLLFPIADATLDAAQLAPPRAPGERELELVYVGNQYGRDAAFDRYVATPARELRHAVFGKWSDVARWPHVDFRGRIGFERVADAYRSAHATVLLLPPRYAAVGQMTQRVFEAALAGCVPLLPADVRGAERFAPAELHVRSGADVERLCRELRREALAGGGPLEAAYRACLARLDLFRASRQVAAVEAAIERVGVAA